MIRNLFSKDYKGIKGNIFRDKKLSCSFCMRTEDQCNKLIRGPKGAYICDECVQDCEKTIIYTKNPQRETNVALQVEKFKKTMYELNKLVGLEEVKKTIYSIVKDVGIRKERERIGQHIPKQALNMVFYGNPGTGKTKVAKMVGGIMQSLGVLSYGHFISVGREDLVANSIGGTAIKTREVLDRAKGGILFIDEAYSLARGDNRDIGCEAIDTIVRFMEDNRGDILIILAGYEKEMEMLWKVNSGLKSRFPIIIKFPDYTSGELLKIAKQTIHDYGLDINKETEQALKELFNKKQITGRTDNGNARMVIDEVNKAIRIQSKRLNTKVSTEDDFKFLLPCDFEIKEAETFDLEEELNKLIGNEEIKNHLRRLAVNVKVQKMRRKQGLTTTDHSLHMIFMGNPGTGKTTVARLVGKILKELEVCKKGQVVEVGRADLVGQYVGHTAPKVKDKVQEALGGILFIDEAYTLANGGENDFGSEAIHTLVQEMENNREELIVILAGYNHEMDNFMNVNPGLRSRFPYIFKFKDYSELELYDLFYQMAAQDNYKIDKDAEDAIGFLINYATNKKDNEIGNGRYVRNMLEKAKQNFAIRVSKSSHKPTKEDLQLLKKEDFASLLPFPLP